MRHGVRSFIVLATVSLATACSPTAATPLAAAPTTAANPTAVTDIAATSAPSDAELHAAIVGAFQAQPTHAYRQSSDTVLKDGATHHTIVEFVPPDKYHIVADATTELIIVGNKVYLKDKAAWTQPDIPVDSLIDRDFVKRLDRSLSDLKWLGAETLNGVSLQVYQYRSAIKVGESEVVGQSKVWINSADQLPYQLVIEGETAAMDNRTGKVTGVPATMTIVYKYDSAIQIAVPQ